MIKDSLKLKIFVVKPYPIRFGELRQVLGNLNQNQNQNQNLIGFTNVINISEQNTFDKFMKYPNAFGIFEKEQTHPELNQFQKLDDKMFCSNQCGKLEKEEVFVSVQCSQCRRPTKSTIFQVPFLKYNFENKAKAR